jgi:fructose-1,6-bisphosphatase I
MAINKNVLTLDEFRFNELRSIPQATGELSTLLRDLAFAAKLINAEVCKAGLVDLLGDAGVINIQGEQVKRLDLFANQTLINCLKRGISCAGIVSEEVDDVIVFDDEKSRQSKYIVAFDPLDGSSNIDHCISIGSIFGIFRRVSDPGGECMPSDFQFQGKNMVAAGYVIYGSSTIFVYATTRSINGFTLDPSVGEFFLSHPDIRCPEQGHICSVNFSNYFHYSHGVRQYLDHIQLKNKEEEGYYAQRHVASMVADLHRNLVKGGIFLNPGTTKYAKGKLRLVYECMPWAFIYEVAGGKAIDGTKRILDIPFTDLHQRTPLFIGSKSMVDDLESYLNKI